MYSYFWSCKIFISYDLVEKEYKNLLIPLPKLNTVITVQGSATSSIFLEIEYMYVLVYHSSTVIFKRKRRNRRKKFKNLSFNNFQIKTESNEYFKGWKYLNSNTKVYDWMEVVIIFIKHNGIMQCIVKKNTIKYIAVNICTIS